MGALFEERGAGREERGEELGERGGTLAVLAATAAIAVTAVRYCAGAGAAGGVALWLSSSLAKLPGYLAVWLSG